MIDNDQDEPGTQVLTSLVLDLQPPAESAAPTSAPVRVRTTAEQASTRSALADLSFDGQEPRLAGRAAEGQRGYTTELQDANYRRIDRLFAILMILQPVFGVALVLARPRSHELAALALGIGVSCLSLLLIKLRPCASITRNVVAVAQLIWSAVFVRLTGDRTDTMFHAYVSLAIVALYRDWQILVPAVICFAIGDAARRPDLARLAEHMGWMMFEAGLLVMSCVTGARVIRSAAGARAEAEASREALVGAEKLAAIGQLATSVGHELYAPLADVRTAARLVGKRLEAQAGADPKVLQFLGIIDRELDVCAKTIAGLLDFANVEPVELEPCSLHELVDEAIAQVATGGAAELVNEVSAELPELILDPDQFRQAIANLLQNALEASAQRVVITAVRGGNGIRVSVADNGRGIAVESLAEIFEPLFTTKMKGTGLGLAIARGVVERHAGKLSVDSELGRGTTFHIDLV